MLTDRQILCHLLEFSGTGQQEAQQISNKAQRKISTSQNWTRSHSEETSGLIFTTTEKLVAFIQILSGL